MINQNEINGSLIEDLGLAGFPKDVQDEMLSRISENILKRVTIAIMNAISPSARPEFDAISQAGDSDRMRAFLNAQIPDLDSFVKEEVRKGVAEFKELAASA